MLLANLAVLQIPEQVTHLTLHRQSRWRYCGIVLLKGGWYFLWELAESLDSQLWLWTFTSLTIISENVLSFECTKWPGPACFILNIPWYQSHGLDTSFHSGVLPPCSDFRSCTGMLLMYFRSFWPPCSTSTSNSCLFFHGNLDKWLGSVGTWKYLWWNAWGNFFLP